MDGHAKECDCLNCACIADLRAKLASSTTALRDALIAEEGLLRKLDQAELRYETSHNARMHADKQCEIMQADKEQAERERDEAFADTKEWSSKWIASQRDLAAAQAREAALKHPNVDDRSWKDVEELAMKWKMRKP